MECAALNIEYIEEISKIPAVATMLEVVCRTTGMGFAAIARVTEHRWIACAVNDKIQFGLEPGGELEIETTICNKIRQSGEAVIIDHVASDAKYCSHPTPIMYGFQSYISVPILLKDGSFFGTLCAIDPKPAKVNTPEIRGMFDLFADLIAFHLSSLKQLNASEISLTEERKIAELREQFIAILGHDLRIPVSAVLNSSQLLLRADLSARDKHLAKIISDSSYRMKELIENVLDFASGRLGSGITLNRSLSNTCEQVLIEVISEVKAIYPSAIIHTQFEISEPVNCDTERLAQLFSNLIGNAIHHGKKEAPIKIIARSIDSEFSLLVINQGNPIPPEIMPKLFQPFARGNAKDHKQGLGLGLYISSEIAKAHGGTLLAFSNHHETRFTLTIPN